MSDYRPVPRNAGSVADAQHQRNKEIAKYGFNTNILDAQIEYDKMMYNRGFEIPEVETGSISLKGMSADKVERICYNVGRGTTGAVHLVMPQGGAAKGIQTTLMVMGVAKSISPLNLIANRAEKHVSRQLLNNYRNDIARRNGNAFEKKYNKLQTQLGEIAQGKRKSLDSNLKFTRMEKAIQKGDFEAIRGCELAEINKILRANGVKEISTSLSGKEIVDLCSKNLIHLDGGRKNMGQRLVSQEVLDALKRGQKLGEAYQFYSSGKSRGGKLSGLQIQLRQLNNRVLQQSGDVGRGFFYIQNITRNATRLTKLGVKALHKTTRMTRTVAQKAMIDVLKRAKDIKGNREGKLEYKAVKGDEKAKRKLEKNNQKKARKIEKNKKPGFAKRVKGRIRESFNNTALGRFIAAGRERKLDRKNRRFLKKQERLNKWNNTAVGKFLNKFSGGITKIKSAFASLKRKLLVAVGGFVLIYVVIILFMMVVQAIAMSLDFANASKKEIVINYLENLYINDLKYMCYCYDGYIISFEDIRDQDAYDEHSAKTNKGEGTTEETTEEKEEDEENTVWFQSTNCAEICSMMYVNFDYDISKYSKKALKKYVEGIYYGSHEIEIDEAKKKIIYRTYYFNSLFSKLPREGILLDKAVYGSCAWYDFYQEGGMHHSPETKKNSSVGRFDVVRQSVYNTLVNEYNYTPMAACAIMGNIQAESAFNPTIHGCNNAYGLYQFDPKGALPGYNNWLIRSGQEDSAENQTRYVQLSIESAFNNYTGKKDGVYVYAIGGQTTDTTRYHVWTMTKYTLDEFKNWNKDSNLTEELIEDFTKNGDIKISGGGPAVKEYINSLSDEEKAVAYATLLFTRVYERPSTKDWITQRVKVAIDYYHMAVGGYQGGKRTSDENPLTPEEVSNNPCYTGHNGGINPFTGGIGLDEANGDRGGNCTAYAWGRRAEMEGGNTQLGAMGNACSWYFREKEAGIYRTGTENPQVGAVVSWRYSDSGVTTATTGRAGHVAVIEEIREDGSFVLSNSAYGSHSGIPRLFYTTTFPSEEAMKNSCGEGNFMGYIFIDKLNP